MALKNIAIILFIVFITSAVHAATDDKTTELQLETTEATDVKVNGTVPENLTETSSEESSIIQTSEVSPISSQSSSTHRKNILYDQRQEGNLNVRLDLENITVIFVPAKKNTQLSLIDLLMKSSQLLQNKNTDKQKNSMKKQAQNEYLMQYNNDEPAHHYKQLQNQFIESRSPYKVEISSTLNQATVDISPNAKQNADASAMNFQPQFARSVQIQRNKRSIDDTLYATYYDQDKDFRNTSNKLSFQSNFSKLINSLDQNIDDVSNESDSDLILIGATEQCGPGSRRDSYGVCQFVDL